MPLLPLNGNTVAPSDAPCQTTAHRFLMVGRLAPWSFPSSSKSDTEACCARNVRTEREENKQRNNTYWLVLAAFVIAMGRSPVSNKENEYREHVPARETRVFHTGSILSLAAMILVAIWGDPTIPKKRDVSTACTRVVHFPTSIGRQVQIVVVVEHHHVGLFPPAVSAITTGTATAPIRSRALSSGGATARTGAASATRSTAIQCFEAPPHTER